MTFRRKAKNTCKNLRVSVRTCQNVLEGALVFDQNLSDVFVTAKQPVSVDGEPLAQTNLNSFKTVLQI